MTSFQLRAQAQGRNVPWKTRLPQTIFLLFPDKVQVQDELLVAALQDRSPLAYMRYRGGVDTLLNALDADRDLFAAELELAQIRHDELQALVQLHKALGGGWQQ
jgi:outer membrane protein TolC